MPERPRPRPPPRSVSCPIRAAVILTREPGAAYRTVAEITEDARALAEAATAVRAARTARARKSALAVATRALTPYNAHADVAEAVGGGYELRVQFTTGRYVNGRLHYYLPAALIAGFIARYGDALAPLGL